MAEINELYKEAEKLKDEGKLDESIAKLQEILARDESHVLAHLTLAVVYGRVGKHEDAVRHGQRACEIQPTDPFNFTALSVTYQRAWQGTQNQQFIQLAEDAMAKAHMLEGQ
jgi:tetratricopeptide (TPR) repeat protein